MEELFGCRQLHAARRCMAAVRTVSIQLWVPTTLDVNLCRRPTVPALTTAAAQTARRLPRDRTSPDVRPRWPSTSRTVSVQSRPMDVVRTESQRPMDLTSLAVRNALNMEVFYSSTSQDSKIHITETISS